MKPTFVPGAPGLPDHVVRAFCWELVSGLLLVCAFGGGDEGRLLGVEERVFGIVVRLLEGPGGLFMIGLD